MSLFRTFSALQGAGERTEITNNPQKGTDIMTIQDNQRMLDLLTQEGVLLNVSVRYGRQRGCNLTLDNLASLVIDYFHALRGYPLPP
jgi:hypothetical protein